MMKEAASILLISLVAHGCSPLAAQPVSNDCVKHQQLSNAIKIRVTPSTNEALVGQAIDITAEIIDDGFEPIIYAENEFPINTWSINAACDGANLPFSEQGRKAFSDAAASSYSTAKMAHGQRLRVTFQMNRLYDLGIPGEYTFTISRRFWHETNGVRVPFQIKTSTTVLIKKSSQVGVNK